MLNNQRIITINILAIGLLFIVFEFSSFGNYGFSELLWALVGVVILIQLFRLNRIQALHTPIGWVLFGQLLWVIQKYVFWLFASRTGYSWFFIQYLFSPLSKISGTSMGMLVLCFIVLFLLLFSVPIALLLVKKKLWKSIAKTPIFWISFFCGILLINIALTNNTILGGCTDLNCYSEGITCRLRNALGWVGSSWVLFTYLSAFLFYCEGQRKEYGELLNIPGLYLSPLLITILVNPVRILSVILSVNHHEVHNAAIKSMVEINILVINLTIAVCFLVILPLGLTLIQKDKMRRAWTFFGSLFGYLIVTGILFYSLNNSQQVLSFSLFEKGVIVGLTILSFFPVLYLTYISQIEKCRPDKTL